MFIAILSNCFYVVKVYYFVRVINFNESDYLCSISPLCGDYVVKVYYFVHVINFNESDYLCSISPLCGDYIISRIWNETWLASFFYKPCNYELFVKQSLNMEMAIVMARVCILFFHLLHDTISIFSLYNKMSNIIFYNFRRLEWIGFSILTPMN